MRAPNESDQTRYQVRIAFSWIHSANVTLVTYKTIVNISYVTCKEWDLA